MKKFIPGSFSQVFWGVFNVKCRINRKIFFCMFFHKTTEHRTERENFLQLEMCEEFIALRIKHWICVGRRGWNEWVEKLLFCIIFWRHTERWRINFHTNTICNKHLCIMSSHKLEWKVCFVLSSLFSVWCTFFSTRFQKEYQIRFLLTDWSDFETDCHVSCLLLLQHKKKILNSSSIIFISNAAWVSRISQFHREIEFCECFSLVKIHWKFAASAFHGFFFRKNFFNAIFFRRG